MTLTGELDGILVHYGEIALKGDNREYFEEKLVENLRVGLGELSFEGVSRIPGRILVELDGIKEDEIPDYAERVSRVFGIVNYSFVKTCPRDLSAMKELAWDLVKDESFGSFRIEARRAVKDYRLNSVEINERVGGYLQTKFEEAGSPREVDLEEPDLTLHVEMTSDHVFLYKRKREGAGGLPTGTAGKVLALLSAGIDSPVAAWRMMKRGAKADLIHFHTYPRTDKASQENVRDIARVLAGWQGKTRLYLVNIRAIQRRIIIEAPKRLRILFYRRAMLEAAELLAREVGAAGLVTGDSLAQVSSQTLENLKATSESVSRELPVYRPNVGMDKREIESLARRIGTYPPSARKSKDCCVYMRPEHPETRASLESVRKVAQSMDTEVLVREAVEEAEVEEFR